MRSSVTFLNEATRRVVAHQFPHVAVPLMLVQGAVAPPAFSLLRGQQWPVCAVPLALVPRLRRQYPLVEAPPRQAYLTREATSLFSNPRKNYSLDTAVQGWL